MREPREYEAPLCAQVGGDFWFSDKEDPTNNSLDNIQIAKRVCGQCIHRIECAEWGIRQENFGIWGGLTTYERKAIRSKRKKQVRE